MPSASDTSPVQPLVPELEPLKAWIAQQDDYARKHGEPLKLTDLEKYALTLLRPRPPSPDTSDDDDDEDSEDGNNSLASQDWISLLMRYTQAKKPAQAPPRFEEESVARTWSASPLWRNRCQIADAPGQWFPDIPREDAGGAPSNVGLYSKKKEARQYAARCAVQWLRRNNYMAQEKSTTTPSRLVKRPFSEYSQFSQFSSGAAETPSTMQTQPQASTPSLALERQRVPMRRAGVMPSSSQPSPSADAVAAVAAAAAVSAPSMAGATAVSASAPAATAPAPAPAPAPAAAPARQSMASWRPTTPTTATTTTTTTGKARKPLTKSTKFPLNDNDLNDVPNTLRLDALCRLLRQGMPVYDLQSGSDGAEGIFSGRVTLGPRPGGSSGDGGGLPPISLPPGVGEVRDVYTKKAARERAAQSLLAYLDGQPDTDGDRALLFM